MANKPEADSFQFSVKVIPRASKNSLQLGEREELKIHLTSPALEGEANKSLIAFLSKSLKVSKSSICIVRGEKSRTKILEVTGMTKDEMMKRLEF